MTIFRSPERDAALRTLLAADRGAETWRIATLRAEAGDEADLLFPGGAVEMIEAWLDVGDRSLAAEAATGRIAAEERVSRRVRAAVLARIDHDILHADAMRRATAILALPPHGATGARALARTVDAIWRAAGDRSADFSWYTKRATLAAVYAATALYAFGQARTDAEIEEFLDRRLAGVARLGRLRTRGLAGLRAA